MAISTIGTNGIEDGSIVAADIATGAVTLTSKVSGVLPIANGGTGGTNGAIGFKNRIINGNMNVDQRNNGSSVSNAAGSLYTLDRWLSFGSQASKFTIQQNSGNAPASQGFSQCAKITSSSAYTVGAGEIFGFQQPIEGYNIADLGWGTASAKPVTLSFWVYSSLTGTFGGSFYNDTRYYVFSYSIPTANTWTQISIPISGDVTGTWAANSSAGLYVYFSLGTGSNYLTTAGSWSGSAKYSVTGETKVVGTSGATWYVTGVQLEVGTAATNFDVRSYGTELGLCQRYYTSFGSNELFLCFYDNNTTTRVAGGLSFPVAMRIAPTTSYSTNALTSLVGLNATTTYVSYIFGTTSRQGNTEVSSITASAEL